MPQLKLSAACALLLLALAGCATSPPAVQAPTLCPPPPPPPAWLMNRESDSIYRLDRMFSYSGEASKKTEPKSKD